MFAVVFNLITVLIIFGILIIEGSGGTDIPLVNRKLTKVDKFVVNTKFAANSNTYQNFQYQEPIKENIEKQKSFVVDAIKQADSIIKNKEVDKNKGQSFNLPDFGNRSSVSKYISKALDASEQIKTAQAKNDNSENIPPIIFVSLSMPKDELKQLLFDANKIKSPVIIRGIYKDLKQTIEKIQEISLQDSGILIDPTQFKKYQITKVPTFILPISEESYVKGCGSVTLDYFLNLITRTGKEEEILKAKHWLRRL
ncbi:MAG: type-F conjugative transfer system pilin assembly protein TrbC [Oligoflexia bacterium]|nr:type-F conjugative transfer system pilin assembly protein TrbC [Oligoflexia bacterium]